MVIVDGKRNDIGSTAAAYARGYLGRGQSAWSADALTVSPYLGDDSLVPFVELAHERGAGLFVLVKTSNPGGGMLQDVVSDGQPLYRHVAQHVEQLAAGATATCGYGSVGAVVGATYPEQLAELRAAMPHTWFLVPGYGSQGGTAADVAGGFDGGGLGAIVNNSRGILFAYRRPEYAERFGDVRWQAATEAATLRHDRPIASRNAGRKAWPGLGEERRTRTFRSLASRRNARRPAARRGGLGRTGRTFRTAPSSSSGKCMAPRVRMHSLGRRFEPANRAGRPGKVFQRTSADRKAADRAEKRLVSLAILGQPQIAARLCHPPQQQRQHPCHGEQHRDDQDVLEIRAREMFMHHLKRPQQHGHVVGIDQWGVNAARDDARTARPRSPSSGASVAILMAAIFRSWRR